MKYGLDMMIRDLNEEEGAAAIFDRVLPGMRERFCANPAAEGMSIGQLASYAKGMIPEHALKKLDHALKEYGKDRGLTEREKAKVMQYKRMLLVDAARLEESIEDGERYTKIRPGKVWNDTNGNRIQAHGGAIFYEDGMYYWYGENKEHTTGDGNIWTWGIRVYQSADLYNWNDLGLLIAPDVENPDSNLFPDMRVDRPHIRKCPATGKYVAWIKLSGIEACFLIMQAERFLGPYEIVKENYCPLGAKVGDFDIVTDEQSGKSYLYFDADHQGIVCAEMSEDMLSAKKEVSRSYTGLYAPFCREGVAMVEHAGKKYMFTSGMTGYVPNQSDTAVAGLWTDEFQSIGDPYPGDNTLSSFNSQFTQIFKVPGRDLSIALSDRWVPEFPITAERADAIRRVIASRYDQEKYQCTEEEQKFVEEMPMLDSADTSIADYVWLPVRFEGDTARIEWLDEWRIEDFDEIR